MKRKPSPIRHTGTSIGSRHESGFTLVEILVVMLILALLAAIAIPSFFSQTDKAQDSGAKANARTAARALETYATDADGFYTGATIAALVAIEPTLPAATVSLDNVSSRRYTVVATSPSGTIFEIVRAADGSELLTCDNPGNGGCSTAGTW